MIGIVILNYNTPEDVINCARSIYKETHEIDFKIYIVDNASTNNSVAIIKEFCKQYKDICFIQAAENNGFSAGNNIGIKAAISDRCEYVCLINADVILLNDAISISVKKLENDAELGMVAPIIVTNKPETESQFARNKLTFASYLTEKTFLKRTNFFNKKYPRYQKRGNFEEDYKFLGMTYGCMYTGRTSFFEKTNLLDESVFLFNEEDILAYKLETLNLYTLITPEGKILHNHHSSISKIIPAKIVFHLRVSPMIVLRKYQGINTFVLMGMVFVNILMWGIKSIFDSGYRSMFALFLKSNVKIFKYKKNEGVYHLLQRNSK